MNRILISLADCAALLNVDESHVLDYVATRQLFPINVRFDQVDVLEFRALARSPRRRAR